ncbi:hypothetical protein TREPR_1390 [Treponema primitia ZAS-2]|uniref:Fimbrial assembly protein n=1 Tax=Treponema primitia (strain ATCC BAA-887 / DSM 12427 / ZAS-2) TaxID=545694 RepID=F5YQQ1_TREPZ|nr:PilN domain-containing protein [Treponema primitia]AEF83748.1 hypothetical protein TREPR_1390 [Treponema primitia ZAS-2]
MPPLPIFNETAFLVSPLDIMVFLLKLKSRNKDIAEIEIRTQLKTLYPGNPEEMVFDYRIYGPKRHKQKYCTAAVFVSTRTLYESYKKINRPLIPGIILMSTGTEDIRSYKKIVILITPRWIEAGQFEQGKLFRYASYPKAEAGNSPESTREDCIKSIENMPTSPISPFFTETDDKEIPIFLINAGVEDSEYKKTVKVLETLCKSVIPMDIGTINPRRACRLHGIFHEAYTPSPVRKKNIIYILVLLNLLSLIGSFRIIIAGTNQEMSLLQEYCREQELLSKKAASLEREIGELNSRQSGGKITIYEAIGGLQSCLPKGWVKSLVIQEGKISLEAEGDDSLNVLGRLQSSGLFSNLTLHQASPSGIAGEVFSISGNLGGINNGKN